MQLERYSGIDKEHTIWELMLILVIEEQIDHTKHLTMDLGNKTLKLIITDRNTVLQKIGSYTSKFGEIRSRSNILF